MTDPFRDDEDLETEGDEPGIDEPVPDDAPVDDEDAVGAVPDEENDA